MRNVLLKVVGGHFMDNAVEIVKGGGTLRGTSDNWDMKVLVATRKLVDNKDFNLMASNLTENRFSFTHLPNDVLLDNISTASRNIFSLNMAEWKHCCNTSKILVGRIITEFFKKCQNILNTNIVQKWLKSQQSYRCQY